MGKGRLEAFSDGVIAIIITIMVLELKRPDEISLAGLAHVAPHFVGYALSFIYVGIYWNNHHHLFRPAKSVTGGILWANLHLLFWLSLVPFASSWMGENYLAGLPVALYGVVLLMTAIAYDILVRVMVRHEGQGSTLEKALGANRKGLYALAGYAVAIGVSFVVPILALAIYGIIALSWLIPDPRIERVLKAN